MYLPLSEQTIKRIFEWTQGRGLVKVERVENIVGCIPGNINLDGASVVKWH